MKKMIGILCIVIVLCIMVLTCPAAAQGILFFDSTDSQDPVSAFTPYMYTIIYAFDPQASSASIIDHLPFGVSFDSATANGIYDSATNSVVWDVSETSAGSVSVTVIPNHIPFPVCGEQLSSEQLSSLKFLNRAVITIILPSGPESAIEDEFTTIISPVPTCGAEFPSPVLPATMIIGVLGAVLLIQRTREH
jgi:hypothetical protein